MLHGPGCVRELWNPDSHRRSAFFIHRNVNANTCHSTSRRGGQFTNMIAVTTTLRMTNLLHHGSTEVSSEIIPCCSTTGALDVQSNSASLGEFRHLLPRYTGLYYGSPRPVPRRECIPLTEHSLSLEHAHSHNRITFASLYESENHAAFNSGQTLAPDYTYVSGIDGNIAMSLRTSFVPGTRSLHTLIHASPLYTIRVSHFAATFPCFLQSR